MLKITCSYKNLFFSSDPHYGHFNIIGFCQRPFSSSAEMTEKLIENWNNKIKKDDIAILCGDFSLSTNRKYLAEILFRLNGKMYLALGNHDKWIKHEDLKNRFIGISDIIEVNVCDNINKSQCIIACHYPIYRWNKSHRGSWHIYGHSHQKDALSNYSNYAINVGVDAWNYCPVSFDEIKKIILTQEEKVDEEILGCS